MKITISWRYFPECPKATDYDRSRSYLRNFLGLFVNITLFVLAIGFFVCMSKFWTDADWGQFFCGFFCILSGGALAHMLYVWYPHCTEKGLQLIFYRHKTNSFDIRNKLMEKELKRACNDALRETTKRYYFWYLSVVVLTVIVSVFIYSVVRLAMNEDGIGWLLFSLCAAVGAIFGFLRLKNVIYGPITPLSHNESQSATRAISVKTNAPNTSAEIYCHKCGRKLSVLQAFCQSCGTPVVTNSNKD